MRAIWASWNDGDAARLPRRVLHAHADDAVLQPRARTRYGPPKVFLAAVGEQMTEVAGEVADGIIIHGFTTERYVKEVTMPAVERGLAKAGRDRASIRGLGSAVRRHRHERRGDRDAAKTATQQQIAFYGSTPAYRGVLELHGWGDLQTELNALSKQGSLSLIAVYSLSTPPPATGCSRRAWRSRRSFGRCLGWSLCCGLRGSWGFGRCFRDGDGCWRRGGNRGRGCCRYTAVCRGCQS